MDGPGSLIPPSSISISIPILTQSNFISISIPIHCRFSNCMGILIRESVSENESNDELILNFCWFSRSGELSGSWNSSWRSSRRVLRRRSRGSCVFRHPHSTRREKQTHPRTPERRTSAQARRIKTTGELEFIFT